MRTDADLTNLIRYIDENIRASDDSGIDFIDPRNYKKRLFSKQNHVVYGRRGSGKTSLVNELKKEMDQIYPIKINLEEFKGISFPNILIHVFATFFKELKKQIIKDIDWCNFLKVYKAKKIFKKIKRLTNELEIKLLEPDNFNQNIKEKKREEATRQIGASRCIKAEISGKSTGEIETETQINIDKLDVIKNKLPSIKEAIQDFREILINKVIFLIFDDFYFLQKSEQPYFIDFFHRLAKDSSLFIKVATIKHRSKLYTTTSDSYYGMEIGHDVQEIDLDYTLDRFEDLKKFMKELLNEACRASNTKLDFDKILSQAGFIQLCLASGGVPRDFLSLFVKVASSTNGTIGKVEVTNAAIANFPNKYDSFKSDSAEEKDTLENCLNHLKQFVIETNRTNIILVPNEESTYSAPVKQAIKELVDLRMLHLVDSNTSCAPSDGKMYSAYMIDIGSYRNPKQRNFKQIEPSVKDEKSRKDNIRSAPKLDIEEFHKVLKG